MGTLDRLFCNQLWRIHGFIIHSLLEDACVIRLRAGQEVASNVVCA